MTVYSIRHIWVRDINCHKICPVTNILILCAFETTALSISILFLVNIHALEPAQNKKISVVPKLPRICVCFCACVYACVYVYAYMHVSWIKNEFTRLPYTWYWKHDLEKKFYRKLEPVIIMDHFWKDDLPYVWYSPMIVMTVKPAERIIREALGIWIVSMITPTFTFHFTLHTFWRYKRFTRIWKITFFEYVMLETPALLQKNEAISFARSHHYISCLSRRRLVCQLSLLHKLSLRMLQFTCN